jgi:hypothetical protein
MARMDLGTPLTEGVTLNQSSEEDEIIVCKESTGFEGRALEQRFAVQDVQSRLFGYTKCNKPKQMFVQERMGLGHGAK